MGPTRLIDNLMLPWDGDRTVQNNPGSA
jgi:hypothetical protein